MSASVFVPALSLQTDSSTSVPLSVAFAALSVHTMESRECRDCSAKDFQTLNRRRGDCVCVRAGRIGSPGCFSTPLLAMVPKISFACVFFLLTPPLTTPDGLPVFATLSCCRSYFACFSYFAFSFAWA